jgi:D-3-phosphoglycerate dehydrogenase
MTHNLILTEALPEPGMRVLAARSDVRVTVLPAATAQALAAALPVADAVILVMERPALTAEMVAVAPRLRVACRCGAGYDNFDIPALTARGIPVVTTGAANADTVAEHALYLMLALAKRGPRLDRTVKAGAWPREFGAVELRDRTCLVVGYGNIGRHVAHLARAFRMRVLVVDPALSAAAAANEGCTVVGTLDEALPQADFVVLACALTPVTRGLMNANSLARMKPSAFLVNVARGPIVDEAALLAALEAGRLAGAGLDVLQVEPPAPGNPLLARDDVVLTPHTAAYIATAYDRMAIASAEKALAGLDGHLRPEDVVNPEAFGPRA